MKKSILIILSIFICSCQSSIQDKIIDEIQQSRHKDSCIIKMTNITSFDWDTMYFFGTNADLSYINKRLGFNYPYFDDIANRIVFVKSKKIVYHDDKFTYPEKKDLVVFSFEDGKTKFMSFTPKTAIFIAKKIDFYGDSFYELSPVAPEP